MSAVPAGARGPTTRRVRLGALVLAVRTWPTSASGRPRVVLLPGTGLTAADWDQVASALQPTREVLAVDLRGHGASDRPGTYSIAAMADDVAGLLDHWGGDPVDLVGHSLGGLVACRVVASRPDRVRRLVLEDVGVPHPRTAAPPQRPPGPLAFDWAVVEQVRPEVDDPDPSWPDVLDRIGCPTLVVAGGPTSHVPLDHLVELVQRLPRAEVVTIEAGHLVHAARPEAFTDRLLGFLDARR